MVRTTELRERSIKRRLLAIVGSLAIAAATLGGASDAAAARFAFTTPTWRMQIGFPGHAFVYPWGMAWDPTTGTILAGDYNNYDIKRFSTSGTLLATYSSKGTGPGQLSGQPYGIAVDPADGSFMVAVLSVHGYMKFAANGTWLKNVSAPGAYYAPFIATGAQGGVYLVQSTGLSQTAPNVVLRFDRSGNLLGQFGSNGSNCGLGQFSLIRGIDTDASGNVYVNDVGNHCIQEFDATGNFIRSFGNGTQLSGNTRGLTIDRSNNVLYVADSAKQHVEVYNIAPGGSFGTFQGTIGTPGSGDGQLGGPRDMAIGTDGTVYVSDYTYWRINAYNPLFASSQPGAFLHQIPDPPVKPAPGGFNMANGVGVSPVNGTVFVTDTFNQRVQEFASITSSTPGAFIQQWGSRLPALDGPFALDYPRGVSIDPNNGHVWVKDTRSGYIKQYTVSGTSPSNATVTFDSEFGGQGSAPGQFFYAVGIFVGPDGTLYIPDSANGRFQVTNQSGAVLHIFNCGTTTHNPSGYNGCTGAALDASGNIYAPSVNQGVVDVFSPSGTLLRTIGATAPSGRLGTPYGVAISGSTLYVTEATNNRVSEFNVNGAFIGSWGSKGSAHGQFNRPLGIAVDKAGNVYVNDFGNDRVEVFTP
jgi:tripartite motif-containing protein 71